MPNRGSVVWYKFRRKALALSNRGSVRVQGGYDVTVGTSERGTVQPSSQLGLPRFRHLLVAFGGPSGLEACLPPTLDPASRDASRYFQKYINTCPGQGSRTIRTEEAILISLAYLQPAIAAAVLQAC